MKLWFFKKYRSWGRSTKWKYVDLILPLVIPGWCIIATKISPAIPSCCPSDAQLCTPFPNHLGEMPWKRIYKSEINFNLTIVIHVKFSNQLVCRIQTKILCRHRNCNLWFRRTKNRQDLFHWTILQMWRRGSLRHCHGYCCGTFYKNWHSFGPSFGPFSSAIQEASWNNKGKC